MSMIDFLLIGLIGLAVGFALRLWIKNRREGNSCCGNCAGCNGCSK